MEQTLIAANEGLKKNNVCAAIICYYPDQHFFNRLNLIREQVDCIIIVDNSVNAFVKFFLQTTSSNNKITYIFNEKNFGIGIALNQGCNYARKLGYQWVLVLDQDTTVSRRMVETYFKIYESLDNKETVAIISSNFKDPYSGKVEFRQQKYRWIETEAVISAGSLISLPAYNNIGHFKEDFFIDSVDFEYCLRARQKRYRIILVMEPLMLQPIGKSIIHSIFGIRWLTLITKNHAPLRYYYMTRNNLMLSKEYMVKESKWITIAVICLLKALFLMLCFEKEKLLKIKYIFLGIYDAIVMDMKRKFLSAPPGT
ncbi:MAG: glycosyltransferase family 2 protein [Candidatus Omnitrophota bacterium]